MSSNSCTGLIQSRVYSSVILVITRIPPARSTLLDIDYFSVALQERSVLVPISTKRLFHKYAVLGNSLENTSEAS